ncbi:MAG TPA: hypothetical protein DCP51_10140 [Clostridiales bacterium]|nr:MAG: hypothetical protein A2X49_08465 [Lentisphaerae bacterium GWF2_52_8]HAN22007.1 hypothetical protein [Clostridiales bacterium]
MNANLHHLQLFYYVAKAKGISAAVKLIPYGIQQPAISQQLLQLERELDVRLFERRPFSLTPAGERLYRQLARFFESLSAEISSLKDAGIRLRFGCPSVISSNYLPPLIRQVRARFPELRPHVSELDGIRSLAALANREIDVAISFQGIPKSKSIIAKKLLTIPLALVIPRGHRFSTGRFWPKTDFAGEKWIAIQEESGGTHELREGLSQFGISPEIVASTNSVEAALQYVEMGLGLALMVCPPPALVEGHQIMVLPLAEIFGNAELSIAWLSDSPLEAKVLSFVHKAALELSKTLG